MVMGRVKRCRGCGQSFRLTWNASTRRWVPLLEADVEPLSRGSLVVVGSVAYSALSDAVQRISLAFGEPETEAYARLAREYLWHLPHPATCPHASTFRRQKVGVGR